MRAAEPISSVASVRKPLSITATTALAILSVFVLTVALWAVIGLLFGSVVVGIGLGIVVALVVTIGSLLWSDAIVLSLSRATVAPEDDYRRLHNLVEGLCVSVGLPKPVVLIIDDIAPNAMVLGARRQRYVIVVTTGLVDMLERIEMEGVVAHLLSRIRQGSVLSATRVSVLVGAPIVLADYLMRFRYWNTGRVAREGDRADSSHFASYLGQGLLVFAPIIAWVLRRFVGTGRDVLSDVAAVQLTRYPPGLIAALEKISQDCTVTHGVTMATSHLWFAEPLSGVGDTGRLPRLHSLFRSHSPLEDRIALLKEL